MLKTIITIFVILIFKLSLFADEYQKAYDEYQKAYESSFRDYIKNELLK